MYKHSLILLTVIFTTAILLFSNCQSSQPEEQPIDSTEAKVEALLSQMTIEEKVYMIHANSAFTSGGCERLGIPEMHMSDGPHGVRHEHGRDWIKDEGVRDSSTYLPVGTALAATWNEELGYEFGKVLGSEANYRKKDMILGPGFNIIRSPLNGRNFEYLTEDPYLNSRMVVGYIKGVQEMGVAACAKHYIANTMEYEREKVDVRMSDRAFREIYLPAYVTAVQEADVLTIMAAYNKFNGTYCAHSQYLLDEVLKDELGFDGLVVSDWAAVKNTDESVRVGLDIEMGSELKQEWGNFDYSAFFMGDTVVSMVKNGHLDEAIVDEKVRRILRVMHRINKFGERQPGAYNTPEHQAVARKVADEGIVLLKNEDVLPLQKSAIKKVAVVGANAKRKHAGGGGSSQVKAFYEITPLQGIKNSFLDGAGITYAEGYEIQKEAKANPQLIAEAVNAVKDADAAIYVGGYIHGWSDEWDDNAYDAEDRDKSDMYLPFGQDEVIEAVLAANPNTVIVLYGGGPADMRRWKDKAKAIVQAWYPGMEGGNALTDILLGVTNPSGKMPMTFPMKLEDSPAHTAENYPFKDLTINHTEDIFVGYRHFDTYNVAPAFAFGHGLSYTTFEFGDLKVNKTGKTVNLSLKVTNTGDMAGAEVVQVYVKDNEASVPRPEKELKAFKKVYIASSASQEVTIELGKDAFSFYDADKKQWVLEPGKFELLVGSSSQDIRLTGEVTW